MRFREENLRPGRIRLFSTLKASKNRSAMFLENDLFKSKTHVSHRWHRRILEKCEALGFPQENS